MRYGCLVSRRAREGAKSTKRGRGEQTSRLYKETLPCEDQGTGKKCVCYNGGFRCSEVPSHTFYCVKAVINGLKNVMFYRGFRYIEVSLYFVLVTAHSALNRFWRNRKGWMQWPGLYLLTNMCPHYKSQRQARTRFLRITFLSANVKSLS